MVMRTVRKMKQSAEDPEALVARPLERVAGDSPPDKVVPKSTSRGNEGPAMGSRKTEA